MNIVGHIRTSVFCFVRFILFLGFRLNDFTDVDLGREGEKITRYLNKFGNPLLNIVESIVLIVSNGIYGVLDWLRPHPAVRSSRHEMDYSTFRPIATVVESPYAEHGILGDIRVSFLARIFFYPPKGPGPEPITVTWMAGHFEKTMIQR